VTFRESLSRSGAIAKDLMEFDLLEKRRTLEKQQIIGRASALAQIGRWEFSEYFAWPDWLFVHLLPPSAEYAEHVGDEKNQ